MRSNEEHVDSCQFESEDQLLYLPNYKRPIFFFSEGLEREKKREREKENL